MRQIYFEEFAPLAMMRWGKFTDTFSGHFWYGQRKELGDSRKHQHLSKDHTSGRSRTRGYPLSSSFPIYSHSGCHKKALCRSTKSYSGITHLGALLKVHGEMLFSH